MPPFTVQDAADLYQVEGWGDGYFHVTRDGTLAVRPEGAGGPEVDLHALMRQLSSQGTRAPVVLRFPQILRHRVGRLNRAFETALADNGLEGVRYRGVFPIKVNQRREVVQELAAAGRPWHYGLEVGSKAELVAALTMDPNPESLLVINGFKDAPFLEAACHATHFKDEVVIVLDEVGELPQILEIMDGLPHRPILGLRLKLRSKAPGKWALSGGERSKFGLTVPEVLWAVDRLREAGHLDRLQMVHFHIGSQISHIRRIAQCVREAGRLHAELVRLGVPLRLIDVGGGHAVDYDGSGSSGANSCNYTMEEYASTVVATLKDTCEDAGIPVPDIISESGRAVVSHHAMLVVDVTRRVPYLSPDPDLSARTEDDPTPLWNLYDLYGDVNAKNAIESFHDAVQYRDDLYTLFDLGHLGLPALARAEVLLRAAFTRIRALLEEDGETESEEYLHCKSLLGQKLVCNFSLFQSLPDIWGVKQQFPIVPIHRLADEPTEVATLADITCDSDGEIRRYIDPMGTRAEMPVHPLRDGEPYTFCIPLVGAYQDPLGDYHNLFGETAEAWIEADGGAEVRATTPGSRVEDMLEWVNYDADDLRQRLQERVAGLEADGRIDAAGAQALLARYVELLEGTTYLLPQGV